MKLSLLKYLSRMLRQAKDHINQVLDEIWYDLPCPARFILRIIYLILEDIFKHLKRKEKT